MAQVALLSRVRVKAGRGEEFVAAMKGVLAGAEEEAGTLLYVLQRARDDAESFWVSEIYADDAALEIHRRSAAMEAARPVLTELIETAESLVGDVVAAKGR
ncbi:hypothetical protein GPX89_28770 [Nocardia sp. ET3-3]|uniref:ABM domain-containing protein n=1 Tax=Nocardia terrae TaxID=2675851 RepID=A0A7K1V3N0_9NOCA|nr:antibiotic biosynthesis monooxygenase [Nocardia terrae]MVU81225.1 hypothetical protein [Nocardia terrae]